MKPFDRVAAQGLGADFATRELDRTEDIIRAFCAEEGARLAPPHDLTPPDFATSPVPTMGVSAHPEQVGLDITREDLAVVFGLGVVTGLGAGLLLVIASVAVMS